MHRQKTFPHELVGEDVVVVNATNQSLVGLEGTVVDETKNTLVVKNKGGQKTIMKSQVDIKLKRLNLVLSGNEIARRPEDRLKG